MWNFDANYLFYKIIIKWKKKKLNRLIYTNIKHILSTLSLSTTLDVCPHKCRVPSSLMYPMWRSADRCCGPHKVNIWHHCMPLSLKFELVFHTCTSCKQASELGRDQRDGTHIAQTKSSFFFFPLFQSYNIQYLY